MRESPSLIVKKLSTLSQSVMRITIVTGPFYPVPPAPAGAAERLWHDLGLRFASLGHQVTFAGRGYSGFPPDQTINKIRYIRRCTFRQTGKIALDLLKDLAYSIRLLPLLPKADILCTNVFWLPVLARHFRRDAGKIVVNIHRFPKRQILLYGSAPRIATVSQAVKQAIIEQLPRVASRVRVFPNPIDTNVFVPLATPRNYQHQKIILFTGRVHPEKGVHLLIQAFRHLLKILPQHTAQSLSLKIMGPTDIDRGGGGPAYLARLKQDAADLNVEFLPAVYDRPALAAVLQSAHFYVYPSLAEKGESFGVAPLEAMATGLPTIVSNLACFRDFVVENQNALVFDHRAPNPAQTLASALQKLMDNPALQQALSHAAAEKASHFSNSHIADLYLQDFHQLTRTVNSTNR